MENLSFSKKHHAMKSMYDDVLTGAQKFSATSLAPRLEDYTEIFGGFHGSRGRSSSIPVLDLPPVEEFEVITVSSSDYSDVFTGFHGVEFAPSFQDLVNLANGGYDSSDEAWSPAHSGSLSDETYPSAWSERSQSITNGDIHHPVNDIKQFNLSYQKAHQRSNGDGTTGMAHITHLHAIPGYTCIVKEKVASENREDEKRPYQGTNDPNYKEDFGVRVAEDKRYNRDVSLPLNNDFQKRGSRLPRWETRSKSGPIPTEPLMTVSDINLRTRPSHLPPPSRPPPVLAVGRGESEKTHPKPKSSRSMSAASLEDALCRTEGNIRNSSNSTDLQDEGLRAFLNLQMEDDIQCLPDHKDGKVECIATPSDVGNDTVGHHSVQWSQAEEVTSSITSEERLRRMNMRDGIYGEIEINLNRKSVKEKLRKNHTSSLGSSKSEEIVMWGEAAGYFEVETDFCSKDYKERKEDTIGNTDIESFENQWQSKTDTKQKESCDKAKLAKIAPERGEKQVNLNKGEVSVKYVPVEGRSRETSTSIFQMEDQKSVQGIGGIVAPETNKEEQRVMQEEIKKVLYTAKSIERNEDDSQHENVTDTDLDMKGASERTEKTVSKANSEKRSEMVSEEVFEIDHLMNRNNENDQTDIENKGKERRDEEEKEKQQNELLGRPKKIQKETHLRIGPKSSELVQQKDEDSSIDRTCKQVDVHHAHEQYKKDSELSLAREEENMVKDCHKLEENEMDLQRSVHHDNFGTEQKEAHQRENGEKLGAHPGIKVYEMRSKEALDQERCRTRSSRNLYEEGAQKNSTEASGVIIKENKGEDTSLDETSTQKAKTDELKKNVTNKGFDRSTTFPLEINGKLAHEVPSIKEVSRPVKGRQNMPDKNLGFSRQVNNSHIAVNTAEQGHPVCPTASINDSEKPFNNVAKILPHMVASDLEVKVTIPKAHRAECIAGMQVTVDDKVQMKKLRKPELASEWVDTAKNISDALQTVLADVGDIRDDHESEASQGMETKMNNVRVKTSRNDGELKNENFMTTKDEKKGQMEREKYPMAKTQKVGGPKGRELHDEHLKRIEEEREREREREKDKTAVENTIREARGRAYVDARERAALERATSEARQRAMAEARERLEKASAEAREARLKAERAAVERATTEARQRAFEKTMAARCNPETNDRVDRTTDKFPSKEMKQSGPACDSYNIQMQNGSRYTNSSAQVGIEGESPQRCKARLERHQRTAERAAKALAEKNMRDLVAQREQEERNRLAEILDADVKRWSSGKEGNLRALLSTLQYILGSDSGWQPIPLTEVITSAAVKRVYRKATLCVHPDKLQQRGANTQQKYICEKVFDLLKEAWNKFNSEER